MTHEEAFRLLKKINQEVLPESFPSSASSQDPVGDEYSEFKEHIRKCITIIEGSFE